MSLLIERPWIVPVVMSVFFFISMIILYLRVAKRKKAFKMIKTMKHNKDLSKVYLRINNGYGNFYDVVVSTDGEMWYKAIFSEDILTSSILLPPGQYEIKFFVKSRSEVSSYYSKKGAFYTKVIVEPFIDTMIVFDNDTLHSWQENNKEENLNE